MCLAAACGGRAPDVTIERFDVAVSVLVDGSAQVQERMTVRTGHAAVSRFRRRSPVVRHDGVSGISATMDGASVPRGEGVGRLQAAEAAALDVQWTVAAAPQSTHVLGLSYRAANVVGISGIRGTVSWLALPDDREHDVGRAAITLTVPESAVLLQDPWVEEAGWDVARDAHGLTATRANVLRSESATAGVEFTIDTMNAARPQWQFDRERASEFMPAFVSAGLFILVIGGGVLAMLRLRFPPATTGPADGGRVGAARDLRTTGFVILPLGLVAWAFVAMQLRQFGIWPLAIPASLLVVGVMFLAAAARMLYFARVRDGRTSV